MTACRPNRGVGNVAPTQDASSFRAIVRALRDSSTAILALIADTSDLRSEEARLKVDPRPLLHDTEATSTAVALSDAVPVGSPDPSRQSALAQLGVEAADSRAYVACPSVGAIDLDRANCPARSVFIAVVGQTDERLAIDSVPVVAFAATPRGRNVVLKTFVMAKHGKSWHVQSTSPFVIVE